MLGLDAQSGDEAHGEGIEEGTVEGPQAYGTRQNPAMHQYRRPWEVMDLNLLVSDVRKRAISDDGVGKSFSVLEGPQSFSSVLNLPIARNINFNPGCP